MYSYTPTDQRVKQLTELSDRLKKVVGNLQHRLYYLQDHEYYMKINVIKKAIAMAKLKQVLNSSKELKLYMSIKNQQIDELQNKLAKFESNDKKEKQVETQKLQKEIAKLTQRVSDLQSESSEAKLKLQSHQSEILKLSDENEDLKSDNSSCLQKIKNLQEGKSPAKPYRTLGIQEKQRLNNRRKRQNRLHNS